MEASITETEEIEHALDPPYVGLRGHELVAWALGAGPECVRDLGSHQMRYFAAICVRKGIKWPEGFFGSEADELMDRS
jgi:hypothetical protein